MSDRLVVVCLLLVCGACTKPKPGESSGEETAPATPVEVAAAKRQTIRHVITAEAILYPMQQASIMPKINAPVVRFFAQRGDHVRKGQLLAMLEDGDLRASAQENKEIYTQAEANYQTTVSATMPDELVKAKSDVESARQLLDAAQKVYETRQALLKEGAIAERLVSDAKVAAVQARSQFENAQQHLNSLEATGRPEQMKSAQAQVAAAKAHYQGSVSQASYAEVRSPISGVISDRPVNVGEMGSSSSALISVVDILRVTARATVTVEEAAGIKAGRPATISGAGVELPGKVSVVSPAVDPNTTTVQIWVEAANPGERLKLGTTVQIAIDAGEIADALVVPVAALLSSDEGGEKVMVAGADSRAHEQPVKIGIRSGDDVQILDGLKEGERVITQGALGLDDKASIEISKAGKK